jgi:hypothetical protein
MKPPRIFLLSPAHAGGKRAATLFRPEATFDLALRMRGPDGAPIGEVFSYISGLYFRGKLAYARAFGAPPPDLPGALVITSGWGLVPVDRPITLHDLSGFSRASIDLADPAYRRPLLADAEAVAARLPRDAQLVLLGSIATNKYVELLVDVFGEALCFPQPFVGMGDMQRGAVMLRAAESGGELPYISARGAVRSRSAVKPRRAR